MVDNSNNGWRDRLVKEILARTKERNAPKDDPRPTMRSASLDAKLGPNYASQLVKSPEKDTQLNDLLALCDVLGIDFSQVMGAIQVDEDAKDLLAKAAALQRLNPLAWERISGLINDFQERVVDEVDANMDAASQRLRKRRPSQP